jgi:CheY-like chemotaxis protein
MWDNFSDNRRVLLVEDAPFLRYAFGRLLRMHGFEVMEANDGREALDRVNEFQPQLVVTDLMMPVMDGAELANAMRNSDGHRKIPIVMMTSLPTAIPRSSGLYDDVLRKPFTPEHFLETVHACLTTAEDRTQVD